VLLLVGYGAASKAASVSCVGIDSAWGIHAEDIQIQFRALKDNGILERIYEKSAVDDSHSLISSRVMRQTELVSQDPSPRGKLNVQFHRMEEAEKPCVDGLTDTVYPISVKLIIDEQETLSGCCLEDNSSQQ
jgi:hypothetical protein